MQEVKTLKKQLYKSLFNSASIGIAIGNGEGEAVMVNRKLCAMLGYTKDELKAINVKDLTHPEDIKKDHSLFSSLLAGEIDSYNIEKRYVRKDGTVFWGLLTVSIAWMRKGSIYVMGAVQDINASKMAEESLLKSKERLTQHNAYKDRLFSIIAHDLKNPVHSAVIMLEILEQSSASFSKEKIVELMSQLKGNMTKVSDILDNLLTWSQSQFREVKYEPVCLWLAEEVAKVTEQLCQQLEQKKITVEILVPEGLQVQADIQMLHVILRNIISNAAKFSDTGKVVKIKAEKKASFVRISVIDEGVGMSEQNRITLLERNMEGYTSYGTNGEKGTGLGVNLCMDYIERHGGELTIESEEGKGSTFTFSVPAVITG